MRISVAALLTLYITPLRGCFLMVNGQLLMVIFQIQDSAYTA